MSRKSRIIDIDIMYGPVMTVANAIAGDYESGCREMGEKVTNIALIEGCIDADRLTFFASGEKGMAAAKAAEAELDRAIDQHGYDKVLKALSRAIRIV